MSVIERLDELYAIGGGRGANRLGGSREEDEAHELVAGWMREAGLEVSVDSTRNLFGRLPGRRPELEEVWTGSHLDSVPEGGRFDGALGVVGGLEAVARAGRQERTLAVVAFRDEEGCSGPGCAGSRAFCKSGAPRPGSFLELHVEQGPRRRAAAVAMAEEPTAALRGEVERLRLPAVELASGAGHDAGVLASAGVPTAMLFVRSLNGGISHSPEELSDEADVELGIQVL